MIKKLWNIFFSQQFFKFAVVGGFSTILNYGIFYILLEMLFIHYIVSSAVGYIAGVLFGFLLNKTWSFESTSKKYKQELGMYFIVYIISLVVGLLFLRLQVLLGIHVLLANFFTICLTTVMNFVGTKYVVFKK